MLTNLVNLYSASNCSESKTRSLVASCNGTSDIQSPFLNVTNNKLKLEINTKIKLKQEIWNHATVQTSRIIRILLMLVVWKFAAQFQIQFWNNQNIIYLKYFQLAKHDFLAHNRTFCVDLMWAFTIINFHSKFYFCWFYSSSLLWFQNTKHRSEANKHWETLSLPLITLWKSHETVISKTVTYHIDFQKL